MYDSNVKKAELISDLKGLIKHGYKCYVTRCGNWGYIITPYDNVLYIQPEYYGGYSFSLEYKPSYGNGSGCQCLENAVTDVTVETVQKAEIEGLRFATKLKASLYKNSLEWLKDYCFAKDLEEIIQDESKQ